MKRNLAFVVAALCIAGEAQAYSGFTRSQLSLYSKLSFNTFSSNRFYTLDGVLRDRGQRFSQHALSLYAEFGVTDHLTIVTNIPALRLNSFANTNTVSGIGDPSLGLKYGGQVLGFELAGSFETEFPLGRSEAFADTDDGGRINLPTGDGEFNFWTRLAISRSIPQIDAYASADFGVNFRTKGFSHQLGFGTELGYNFLGLGYVWLKASLRGLLSVGEPNRLVSFIFGEGTEFLMVGIGASGEIWRPISLTFDYTNVFALQRNVYGGSSFNVGVAVEI